MTDAKRFAENMQWQIDHFITVADADAKARRAYWRGWSDAVLVIGIAALVVVFA